MTIRVIQVANEESPRNYAGAAVAFTQASWRQIQCLPHFYHQHGPGVDLVAVTENQLLKCLRIALLGPAHQRRRGRCVIPFQRHASGRFVSRTYSPGCGFHQSPWNGR